MVSSQSKIFFKDHISKFNFKKPHIEAIPIGKEYVHKKLDKNIAITHPVLLSDEGPTHRVRIVVANENDFFFDHDLRHLPGMLFVEAARQFAVAISHIHFNIPLSDRFILKDIGCLFCYLGNKNDPVYMDSTIIKQQMRDGIIYFMRALCYIHQNGNLLTVVEGVWSTINKEIFDKIENDIIRSPYPRGVMVNSIL